ncbi:MAG: ABC-type phosphate/phosphonate transport system substrate-binding protein [Parasphingorhabdus sp.]|jgi:ABC-type phosphate/phosphonate transport system substrate-binding protein
MTTFHASLPMYDLPEAREHTDRWWQVFRSKIVSAGIRFSPVQLDHNNTYQKAWRSADCLFSQTCGYPYIKLLQNHAQLIATPCYLNEGCDGPNYSSWIVTRNDSKIENFPQTRDSQAVVNSPDSLSGYKVIEMMLDQDESLETAYRDIIESGGHRRSIGLLKQGVGDFAAIDCVTWAYLQTFDSEYIDGLKIIDQGPSLPGLPLITATSTSHIDTELMREVLLTAHQDSAMMQPMTKLLISHYEWLDRDAYQVILDKLL